MDYKPKKSKALLITIIALLILVIVAYFMFKNRDTIFNTKGVTDSSQKFSPLLGTSDKNPTDVSQVENPTQPTQGGVTPSKSSNTENPRPESGIITGNTNGSTSPLPNIIEPPLNPLPTPSSTECRDKNGNVVACIKNTDPFANNPQCSDRDDNDRDILIDQADPACHTDFDATNPSTYDPNLNNENRAKVVASSTQTSKSICPEDDPLAFTEEENAELEKLLRQYYLIASTLKTEDDLDVIENDTLQNKALVAQAKELTKDCKDQKADPLYTGPQTIKNNPYYAELSNNLDTYLSGLTSNWLTTSEYYKPNYGAPTVSGENLGFFGILGGSVPSVTWPDAYRGPKIKSYAEFEKKFNIW